jgi:2Fe-2S ferredoxin
VSRIEIEASAAGPAVAIDAPEAARLLDLCDAVAAPIEVACRGATCLSCCIEVLEGGERLASPGADERAALAGKPSHVRLACQVMANSGKGILRVRWVPR